ncbi:MAG TPA: type II secretion system protein [Abditibacteriaceae bacterium]|jgi:prepilin-type N-terminal cleavage/methylation domain-containing protein
MKSSSPHNLSTRKAARRSYGSRRGFTLIEVMVVLAIAAIVTSITVSGFRSLTDGNRRTTCQTNMSQLYASLRLYAADEGGGFPYYDGSKSGIGPSDGERGIGLWTLYTFPSNADADELAPVAPDPGSKPLERYLRSAKVLHCPADLDTGTINRTSLIIPDPNNSTQKIYNRNYLSYHAFDNGTPSDTSDDDQLYQSSRLVNRTDPNWRRQLLHYDNNVFVNRPPTDDTVVMWCPWHRGVRDFDNVMFYDGSVQIIPRQQNIDDASVCTKYGQSTPCTFTGWQRVPNAPK